MARRSLSACHCSSRSGAGASRSSRWSGKAPSLLTPSRIDSTLVKAIARAHRWQRMLEGGDYGSIAELAAAERINPSYLARILRLTLLEPHIVESILDGRQEGQTLSLHRLLKPFPPEWKAQRRCR